MDARKSVTVVTSPPFRSERERVGHPPSSRRAESVGHPPIFRWQRIEAQRIFIIARHTTAYLCDITRTVSGSKLLILPCNPPNTFKTSPGERTEAALATYADRTES